MVFEFLKTSITSELMRSGSSVCDGGPTAQSRCSYMPARSHYHNYISITIHIRQVEEHSRRAGRVAIARTCRYTGSNHKRNAGILPSNQLPPYWSPSHPPLPTCHHPSFPFSPSPLSILSLASRSPLCPCP